MYNPFSLQGKTILVTGASSGIGRATAVECAASGAIVILVGRDPVKLGETFGLLAGERHLQYSVELTDAEQVAALVDKLPEIDGLVHSAGISIMKPFGFATAKAIDETFAINFYAPVELSRLLLKKRKIHAGGSIVFISSISGLWCTNVGFSVYSASKAAVNGIVKGMALELAPKEIRVNCVHPGAVDTDIHEKSGLTREQVEQDFRNYPLGRYGRPEEVAYAVLYLLSDATRWVTGSNLLIDGGYTLK